jgi:uncharacterized membrane protein
MHHDPIWVRVFLGLHVAAGFTAFVLAPVALVTAKGGKQHKRWGMVYLWAMGVVAGTALPMALYRPVLFLALVAVFSFYSAFSGYRITKLKSLARGGRAETVDWLAALFTFCASACLAGFGVFRPALVQHMGVVAIVFGCLGMRLAAAEMWHFVKKPREKMFWWYTHLGNFIGSYIAAWTAFLVTNVHPRGAAVAGSTVNASLEKTLWLLPTLIGVPAIVLTIAYYKRKFAPKRIDGPATVIAIEG